MGTIIKRTNKSGTYYYFVESARVNGKPRIVNQIYLGTAEKIAEIIKQRQASEKSIPDPEFVKIFDFGAVTALYSIAERLGICKIIDDIAEKRNQGQPVSVYMLLAAINRVVDPTSKNTFYEWFEKTVLGKIFAGTNKKNLSSQGFWNNISVLDEEKIRKIEDEITKQIVEQYGIELDCLLFDNTNFFTYIDTANPSALAKRGHSKEKRTDLKIIGLSLMVSPDYNIPLFHEVYPGNKPDAQQFSSIIGKLKDRFKKLGKGECTTTLVFDKGNNNEDNIADLIALNPCPVHFVGGLRLSQCPELLDIANSNFTLLDGNFHNTTVYKSKKIVYDKEFTVLITNNPELKKAQIEGVLINIASCEKALSALSERLRLRREGIITKGKKPTVESTQKNVLNILSAEHMRDIFDYTVSAEPGDTPKLVFSVNKERWSTLRERSLGKSILFTDHHDWTNEQIVKAYRSQYHVEDAFKQMKDAKYLSFRPIRHFTDNHIRVHAFYCVLAFLLASLLNRELKHMGHEMSIRRMLDMFQDAQQVISVFALPNKRLVMKTSYSRFEGIAKEYALKYDLLKYLN